MRELIKVRILVAPDDSIRIEEDGHVYDKQFTEAWKVKQFINDMMENWLLFDEAVSSDEPL